MPKYFPFKLRPVPRPPRKAEYSPIEIEFWKSYVRLHPAPLRGLTRQYRVGSYIIDFAIPRAKIGIELDGHATHSSPTAIAADRARQRSLQKKGWYIIRFGGQEVYRDSDKCVREAASMALLVRGR